MAGCGGTSASPILPYPVNTTKHVLQTIGNESGKPLARLLAELQRHSRLQQKLDALLASAGKNVAQIGPYRDDSMTLFVTSASQAARLRFQAPSLLAALRSELPALQQITVRIMHRAPPPAIARPASRHISEASARCLRHGADATGDSELSRALLRLAQRAQAGTGCK